MSFKKIITGVSIWLWALDCCPKNKEGSDLKVSWVKIQELHIAGFNDLREINKELIEIKAPNEIIRL